MLVIFFLLRYGYYVVVTLYTFVRMYILLFFQQGSLTQFLRFSGRIFFLHQSVTDFCIFFDFFIHSWMLYIDVQYLLFCFCWYVEHTILDFLIKFELIIVYELTLCGILVLFSLHLLLYAWVLNLVILYHIFFANLNHLCTWFFNQQHTLSFYTSVICMDMKLILCVSRILSRVSFFVIFQKHFLFMFLPLFNDFFSTNMQILWFFTDWIKNSRVRLCLFQNLIFCFTDSFFSI